MQPDKDPEEDYSLMILKNRLAQGEITPQEFDELKRKILDIDSNAIKERNKKTEKVNETIETFRTGRKRSPVWYYLSVYFGIVGSLVTYFKIRKDDPKKARNCLIIGICLLAISVLFEISLYPTFGTENPFYVVSSETMAPSLNVFDVIVVNGNVPFDQLQIGDIIVFNRPAIHDKVIVHRVADFLSQDPRIIKTKGDASPASISGTDYPISKQDYIGKVVYVIPQIGYITRILIPPVNYIIIGVTIVIPIIHHMEYRRNHGGIN